MNVMALDPQVCYAAIRSRDARFDGRFFVAVMTTGVYCRPSCRSRSPRPENVRFYRTAQEAEAAGFRPCRRCRPEEWQQSDGSGGIRPGGDTVGLLLPGAARTGESSDTVDRVGDMAARIGWSPRHLQRLVGAQVGLTPHTVIRFARLHLASRLLRSSRLSVTEVALKTGYPSLRALEEDTARSFALTPSRFRALSQGAGSDEPLLAWGPALNLEMSYSGAFDPPATLRFWARRAVPGLEEGDESGRWFRRVLRLCHGFGLFEVKSPATEGAPVLLTLRLESVEDLGEAVQTVRGSLDLDANPSAVLSTLRRDPLLGPIVEKNPGRRVPGHVNGDEMAIRAILGQQVSVSAARTHTARLVAELGTPLNHPVGTLRFAFPTPEQIVAGGPDLPGMALVASRRRTVYGFAAARQAGDVPPLHRGGDPDRIGRALERLFGIGPWTRAYVALRALGDPDAFLASDLGVRQSLERLAGRPFTAREIERLSEPWRPFRGYAVIQLWAELARTATKPPSG